MPFHDVWAFEACASRVTAIAMNMPFFISFVINYYWDLENKLSSLFLFYFALIISEQ
jgi:hypothetical protein